MVICLERDADLHTAQLMPLPLTVSCFSKIQIGFTFLVQAPLGSPGQRAVKQVCVCVSQHKSSTIICCITGPDTGYQFQPRLTDDILNIAYLHTYNRASCMLQSEYSYIVVKSHSSLIFILQHFAAILPSSSQSELTLDMF